MAEGEKRREINRVREKSSIFSSLSEQVEERRREGKEPEAVAQKAWAAWLPGALLILTPIHHTPSHFITLIHELTAFSPSFPILFILSFRLSSLSFIGSIKKKMHKCYSWKRALKITKSQTAKWNMGWNGKMRARSCSPSFPCWHIQSAGQSENKPESASRPSQIRAVLQTPPISWGEHKPLTLSSEQFYNSLLLRLWPRSAQTQIQHDCDIRSEQLLQQMCNVMARVCAFYTILAAKMVLIENVYIVFNGW